MAGKAPFLNSFFLTPLRNLFAGTVSLDNVLTEAPAAIEELARRREDPVLRRAVEEYLNEDIPPYLKDNPALYLARHIATPNFETIRFAHLAESFNLPAVIGEDRKDIFAPQNKLKRALGKLSVHTRTIAKDGILNEQYRNVTVLDFNDASGKPMKDIHTFWGQSLIEFHSQLCGQFLKGAVNIVDDSAWIDRNHRGNRMAHYKKFLALFLVHGILVEDYIVTEKDERTFVQNVLRPAFRFVERKFGIRPLITPLTPTPIESARFWISYPNEVGEMTDALLASRS